MTGRDREVTDDRGLAGVARAYRFWGRHATWYRLLSAPTFLFQERRIRGYAARALHLHSGDRVLEVACGTGLNLSLLVDAIGPAGRAIGFDYSSEMLAAAERLIRSAGWTNVELHQGDAAELAIPHANLDGALSVLGLSAVPRRQAALRRIHALLRSGARLAVCDARLFQGHWRILNPLIEPLYRKTSAWHADADIPGEMRAVFGNVEVTPFNGGSMYVAVAEKT